MQAEILNYLAPSLRRLLQDYPYWDVLHEIRIRINQPLILVTSRSEQGITRLGKLCQIHQSYCPTRDDLARTVQLITQNSWYALEDEIRSGYVTLPGGHRVRLTGKTILDQGRVKGLKYPSCLNIRIARQVLNAAISL